MKASLEYPNQKRALPKLNVYYSKPELSKTNAIRVESKIIPIAHQRKQPLDKRNTDYSLAEIEYLNEQSSLYPIVPNPKPLESVQAVQDLGG